MTIVKEDGASLTFDLLSEAAAGGSVVVVQTSPDLEEPLKHAVQQPLHFKYYEEIDPEPIEFNGKIMRLVPHQMGGRRQLQIEIEQKQG
jgi:hypothetical protein